MKAWARAEWGPSGFTENAPEWGRLCLVKYSGLMDVVKGIPFARALVDGRSIRVRRPRGRYL